MDQAAPSQSQIESFIHYLVENEIVDAAAARRALEGISRVDLRIGRVALLEGFISPEEINKILWIQREANDRKFGEIAVELKIMKPEDVRRALELQQDELFAFCQSLIIDGLISPGTLYALLKGFLEQDFDREIEQRRRDVHARISKSIRDVLKKISIVAPMPDTVARLLSMLNDPDVDLDEVARVISLDVGLTAMLLRLSNSAFYGLKSQVTTVNKAVTVIGTKKLRQLVISAAMMDRFKNLQRDRFLRFWEQSMRAAQWSKELAQFAGKPEIDEFFLAGFLHNIGEIVILQHFPDEVRRIEELARGGRPPLESEVQVLGCDRADMGSYLLSLWQLPPAVVQASMLAHHPRLHLQQMSGITPESKVVNMAVAIVNCAPNVNAFGQGMHLGQVVEDYKTIIAIDYRNVKEMHERVEKIVLELMRWFSV
ncbi:MAG: hypothetical protein A3G34_05345 [Candidatus Lindowbacteria bacterium RIFCSPLOWO2_12_FULL_62_27]|nr:MAG: hypothetical protein A3G34_05345 [Candidatus Lindowbacteria bacterium RIFCSPLOWO2_12_FULL_62_27]OGH63921.1 MAG: hypothetical protein A3I06_03765 [Candidatus Lindowbacteria bacterium RIFCSPLOWO2_02_FULL_62_12]